MRISDAAFLLGPALLLGACQDVLTAPENAEQPAAAAMPAASGTAGAGNMVPCAHGTAQLAANCTVDRTQSVDGLVLTVRHPDGAFRRLLVTRDGRGVIAADGAEQAKVNVQGDDRIAVTIGEDRYELPATVKGGTPAAK